MLLVHYQNDQHATRRKAVHHDLEKSQLRRQKAPERDGRVFRDVYEEAVYCHMRLGVIGKKGLKHPPFRVRRVFEERAKVAKEVGLSHSTLTCEEESPRLGFRITGQP